MGVSDIQSGDAQICSLSEGAQLIAIIICRLQYIFFLDKQ